MVAVKSATALQGCRGRLRHQAQHIAPARRCRLRRHRDAGNGVVRGYIGAGSRTASFYQMGPAIRPKRANMPCRSSRDLLDQKGCRSSASASATRCWRWRSVARTMKMHQGHHGANHPVKDFTTDKVEIVSMNHGFAVDKYQRCPTPRSRRIGSLFDGSNCGIELTDRPAFSVQYHPEASPGPRDSHYLFQRFVELMEKRGRGGVRRARATAQPSPRAGSRGFASKSRQNLGRHGRAIGRGRETCSAWTSAI